MQYAIRFVPPEHVQAVRDIFKNQGQRTTIKGRGPRSGIGEYRDCAKDKVSHYTVYVHDGKPVNQTLKSRMYFDFNGMKSGKFHMKHHQSQPLMHTIRYEGNIYYDGNHCASQVLRNAVHPEIGRQIMDCMLDKRGDK